MDIIAKYGFTKLKYRISELNIEWEKEEGMGSTLFPIQHQHSRSEKFTEVNAMNIYIKKTEYAPQLKARVSTLEAITMPTWRILQVSISKFCW